MSPTHLTLTPLPRLSLKRISRLTNNKRRSFFLIETLRLGLQSLYCFPVTHRLSDPHCKITLRKASLLLTQLRVIQTTLALCKLHVRCINLRCRGKTNLLQARTIKTVHYGSKFKFQILNDLGIQQTSAVPWIKVSQDWTFLRVSLWFERSK